MLALLDQAESIVVQLLQKQVQRGAKTLHTVNSQRPVIGCRVLTVHIACILERLHLCRRAAQSVHTARHENFGRLGVRLQDVTDMHVGMDLGRYHVAKEQTQIVFNRAMTASE